MSLVRPFVQVGGVARPTYVTASGVLFFTGNGTGKSAQLVDSLGRPVALPQISLLDQTDWQGTIALSDQPRTNWLHDIAFNALTVTQSQPSPDGLSGAMLLAPTTANVVHYASGASPSTGAYLTFSGYAKASGYTTFYLQVEDPAGVYNVVEYDLSAGTATAVGGAPVKYSIAPSTDGYYYCSMTSYSGPTSSATSAFVLIGQSGAFAGDGASGILLFGAMITVAPDAPRPLIPFGTTAPVTVTDYTVSPSGLVTFGQVPASTATEEWTGSGYV